MAKSHFSSSREKPGGKAKDAAQSEHSGRLTGQPLAARLDDGCLSSTPKPRQPKSVRKKPWLEPERPRKSVLLALGFYVHEINVGVAKYARDAGWILTDITSRNGMVEPGWNGDGIISLLASREQKSLIDFMIKARVPIVNLSDELPELPFPRVLQHNLAIGAVAANHFLTRGFEQFAFFILHGASVERERMEGFQQAVNRAQRTFHLLDYSPLRNQRGANGRLLSWMAHRLKQLPKPLAVMAQYDADANDVVRACLQAELHVPEQVAVVGVDNDPIYTEFGPVPLSSVVSNTERMGYEGAALLDRLMAGAKPPREPIRIPPDGVIVRKSSDTTAVEDIHVAKALTFITQHFHEPITVQDIVTISGASRRSLYIRFALEIGHSIHRELIRQRMEGARRLLRETDEKLQSIATRCGYLEAAHLSKAFRQQVGISVTQYRQEHRRGR
jgi:LacI family transcriptional regulator